MIKIMQRYTQIYIYLQKLIIPAQKIQSAGGTGIWTRFYMKINLNISFIDMTSYLKISLWIQRQQILVFSVLSLQGREKEFTMPCTETSLANLQGNLLLKCNLMLRCPKESNSTFATDLQGEESSWSILLILSSEHMCKVLPVWHLALLFYCYFRWFFTGTSHVSPGRSCSRTVTLSIMGYLYTKLAVDTPPFPLCISFPVKFCHYFACIKDNQGQTFDKEAE